MTDAPDRWALVKDGEILEYRDYAPEGDQSKLAPGKARMLPVEVTDPAFNPVTQVRTGPVVTVLATKVKEVYSVRAKSADERDAMRAEKVAAIKAEAEARIVAIMPRDAQVNALAQASEAVLTHGPSPADWPVELQTAASDNLAKWAAIKAIRTRSNELEAGVAALTTAAEIDAFDPAQGWD